MKKEISLSGYTDYLDAVAKRKPNIAGSVLPISAGDGLIVLPTTRWIIYPPVASSSPMFQYKNSDSTLACQNNSFPAARLPYHRILYLSHQTDFSTIVNGTVRFHIVSQFYGVKNYSGIRLWRFLRVFIVYPLFYPSANYQQSAKLTSKSCQMVERNCLVGRTYKYLKHSPLRIICSYIGNQEKWLIQKSLSFPAQRLYIITF